LLGKTASGSIEPEAGAYIEYVFDCDTSCNARLCGIGNCIGWTELPQVVSFFIITFRGTHSNRLEPGKVGGIGFRISETDPEMAIGIRTLNVRLRGCCERAPTSSTCSTAARPATRVCGEPPPLCVCVGHSSMFSSLSGAICEGVPCADARPRRSILSGREHTCEAASNKRCEGSDMSCVGV